MATKRGLRRALIKAAIIGAASGASVFIGAVSFDHAVTTRNDNAIRNRGAFFEFVMQWQVVPAALGAAAASLLVDRTKWKQSYTLAEFQKMAALGETEVETLAKIIEVQNHEERN